MNYKNIFYFLVVGFAQHIVAMEGNRLVLLLPINHMVPIDQRVTLSVAVPESFRPLSHPMAPTAEFIPKTDSDSYKWSQMITTQFIKGLKVSARDMLRGFKTEFGTRGNARVIDASGKENPSFSLKTLAMAYESRGRRELVYMQYVSGPADCAGVQYALPLSATRDEAQALAQAEEFMKQNVTIVVGNGQPSTAID